MLGAPRSGFSGPGMPPGLVEKQDLLRMLAEENYMTIPFEEIKARLLADHEVQTRIRCSRSRVRSLGGITHRQAGSREKQPLHAASSRLTLLCALTRRERNLD